MNIKSKHIVVVIAVVMVCLSGCTKYDADDFTGKIMPRVSGYTTGVTNDWIYFNLRTGEVFNRTAPNQDIKEGEQLERTDWDLAFCGYHMRTNSGTSGPGKGGAIDLGYGNYDGWTGKSQIPSDAQWVVDDSTSVYVTYSQAEWYRYVGTHNMDFDDNPWFEPNSGPKRKLTSANPLLEQAMNLTGPPMTYTPSYHTYCVRTADGQRYFKLQIVSWYNQNSEIDETGGQLSYYVDELQ